MCSDRWLEKFHYEDSLKHIRYCTYFVPASDPLRSSLLDSVFFFIHNVSSAVLVFLLMALMFLLLLLLCSIYCSTKFEYALQTKTLWFIECINSRENLVNNKIKTWWIILFFQQNRFYRFLLLESSYFWTFSIWHTHDSWYNIEHNVLYSHNLWKQVEIIPEAYSDPFAMQKICELHIWSDSQS